MDDDEQRTAAATGRTGATRRFRRVFSNRDVRRILAALGALMLGGSAYQVGLAVVAFSKGGAGATGIAFAVQVLPVALLAPLTSILADRYDRRRLMVAIDVLRCACTAAVAVAVASDASLALILALGAPGALASGAYAPASRALLPSLVGDPQELTATNAALSGVEHAALLVGPALVGLLLLVAAPGAVFAAGSVMFLASGLLVAGVRSTARAPQTPVRRNWRAEATAGLRTVFGSPDLRVLIGVYAAVMFVVGALQVFAVVIASELTGLGDSGVGAMFSALGAGGLLGTIAAVALAERTQLSRLMALGLVLVGGPLVVIGLIPHATTALAGVAVIGSAIVVTDVAVITLLQRAVADDVLGRVFGVLESVLGAMIGLGSLAVALLISAFGNRGALVAAGGLLPLLGALLWTRLRRIDAPSPDTIARVALLRGLPIFAPLPAPTLESLAANLQEVDAADGEVVIRQGDAGDLFYVVREGTVEATVDGAATSTHGPGEGFGEIALLRDIARTATVTARGPARLYALERDVFLSAVTAHPVSAAAGDAVVAARLARGSSLTPVSMA